MGVTLQVRQGFKDSRIQPFPKRQLKLQYTSEMVVRNQFILMLTINLPTSTT